MAALSASPQGRIDVERYTKGLSEADRARAITAWQPYADKRVWDFIQRAIAART